MIVREYFNDNESILNSGFFTVEQLNKDVLTDGEDAYSPYGSETMATINEYSENAIILHNNGISYSNEELSFLGSNRSIMVALRHAGQIIKQKDNVNWNQLKQFAEIDSSIFVDSLVFIESLVKAKDAIGWTNVVNIAQAQATGQIQNEQFPFYNLIDFFKKQPAEQVDQLARI